MIASLVYHTIYSFNTINENNIRNMVKYVDFVLAFCCIHSIVYLIMINNNLHRNIFLFISTFLEMYFNYISLGTRISRLMVKKCITQNFGAKSYDRKSVKFCGKLSWQILGIFRHEKQTRCPQEGGD